MYTLYRLGSNPHDPDALWLSYEWDDSFENREWRLCVEHFLGEVAGHGHEIAPLSSPPFAPCEDCVEIAYRIGGIRTAFKSDLLLSLIIVTPEDSRILRGVWDAIGHKVGWERE
jgi:hypothetical protein